MAHDALSKVEYGLGQSKVPFSGFVWGMASVPGPQVRDSFTNRVMTYP